jgi:hypothetical protein
MKIFSLANLAFILTPLIFQNCNSVDVQPVAVENTSQTKTEDKIEIGTAAKTSADNCMYHLWTLWAGETLFTPVNLTCGGCMKSQNGLYKLCMQYDNNLVAYRTWDGTYYWQTKTYGGVNRTPGGIAKMQTDGNFVVYSGNNYALYQSGTSGRTGCRLMLQDDNNIVVGCDGGYVKGLYR